MTVQILALAVALVLLIGPIWLGLVGFLRSRGVAVPTETDSRAPWNRRLTWLSMLLFVLAFNLTFFIQELFLVLPKAFTPGLRVTLFHNNHSWEGEHPLAKLFQGAGASATAIVALVCIGLLRWNAARSTTLRLFLIWMAYCGLFMALPQVAIGALSDGSDVGMAMNYLGWSAASRTVAALVSLALVAPIARWLTHAMLGLANSDAQIATAGARTRFVFWTATLPVVAAIVPILAFRVPREWIEVVLPPIVIGWIGVVWMQAGAWRIRDAEAKSDADERSSFWPLLAVLLLLLIFQCVLRPGIRFA